MDSASPRTVLAIAACLLVAPTGFCAAPPRRTHERTHKPIGEIRNTLARSIHLALFLPKSDQLVLGGGFVFGPGELTFCNTTTLKTSRVLKDHKLAICAVAASPDGSRIVTGGGDGEIKVYDATGKVLAHLDAGGGYCKALAFSSDGKMFASAAWNVVKIWDLKTLKELVSGIPDVETAPFGMAFSPDGKWLAFGDWTGVKFWDVSKRRVAFQAPYVHVCSLLFTPDGKHIVVGGGGGGDKPAKWPLIHVWNLEKKKEVRVLKGHAEGQAVVSLALDRSGKYLVSGCGDQTVRIWELATGKEVACLAGNESIVRGLAISNKNEYLITCGELIRVWDLRKLLGQRRR